MKGGPAAIDVCAGAGGLSLGLHRAGWEVLGVELDGPAVAAHRANVGPCEHADVTTYHPAGPALLVAGGVPCQPFSDQGKRRSLDDPRGRLFEHLVRIAREAGARVCMLENVKGIAHHRAKDPEPALVPVAEAFIRGGFPFLACRLLDAADYGVPQHRQRLILIGFREAEDAARFAWPAPTHGPGRARPFVTVRQALGLGDRAFEAGQRKVTDGDDRRGRGWFQGGRAIDVDAPGYTVGTRNNADLLVPRAEQVTPANVLDVPARTITSSTHDETPCPDRPLRRYGPILRHALAEEAERIALNPNGRSPEDTAAALAGSGLLDRASTTISATGRGRLARPGHKLAGDQWKGAVRLNEAQCAALQDFPAHFQWPSKLEDAHRLIGNAVPPGLGEALGRALLAALVP